jgi:hypothetical protein
MSLEHEFPSAEDFATDRDPERSAPFRAGSHTVVPRFPFEHAAVNDLLLHDRLIDLAEELLGPTDLRSLYLSPTRRRSRPRWPPAP